MRFLLTDDRDGTGVVQRACHECAGELPAFAIVRCHVSDDRCSDGFGVGGHDRDVGRGRPVDGGTDAPTVDGRHDDAGDVLHDEVIDLSLLLGEIEIARRDDELESVLSGRRPDAGFDLLIELLLAGQQADPDDFFGCGASPGDPSPSPSRTSSASRCSAGALPALPITARRGTA